MIPLKRCNGMSKAWGCYFGEDWSLAGYSLVWLALGVGWPLRIAGWLKRKKEKSSHADQLMAGSAPPRHLYLECKIRSVPEPLGDRKPGDARVERLLKLYSQVRSNSALGL